jgi:hypothetical protein
MRLFSGKIAKFAGISALILSLGASIALAEDNSASGAGTGVSGTANISLKVHASTLTGTVNAISGTTITLSTSKGSISIDASNAKLVRRFGAAMLITDAQVGDQLVVRGILSTDATSLVASMVRDMSLQARNGTFSGKIVSVGSNSFMLQSNVRGGQTINITSSTVIKRNGQAAQFSDLAAGQSVRVSGVWDRTNSNVTATSINIIIKVLRISINGSLSAVSGNTLTVTSGNNTYTVDVTHASLVRKFGGKSSLSEFNIGDNLQVRGKHEDGSMSVTASLVRDLSITAKSVKASTTGNN